MADMIVETDLRPVSAHIQTTFLPLKRTLKPQNPKDRKCYEKYLYDIPGNFMPFTNRLQLTGIWNEDCFIQ
jgi:hypothetical protein